MKEHHRIRLLVLLLLILCVIGVRELAGQAPTVIGGVPASDVPVGTLVFIY